MKRSSVFAVALASVVALAAPAHAMDVRPGYSEPRSAVAVHHPDGSATGSPAAHEPRPALSLSKLYLGYWVLHHGTDAEKALVADMIRHSDDAIATRLDRRYPHAIDEIARDFHLAATRRGTHWGATSTSAHDVARFLSEILPDPVAAPLLDGMRTAAPVAADGFVQNYGTSQLPGALGTKYGWSDDFTSLSASASFGDGWTAAALTYGGAPANTVDVLAAVEPGPFAQGQGGWTSSLGPLHAPAVPLRNVLAPHLPMQVVEAIPADVLVPVAMPSL